MAEVRAEEIEISGIDGDPLPPRVRGHQPKSDPAPLRCALCHERSSGDCLARRYTIDIEQILESLRHLRQAHMRGQTLQFREGFYGD